MNEEIDEHVPGRLAEEVGGSDELAAQQSSPRSPLRIGKRKPCAARPSPLACRVAQHGRR